MPKQPGAAAVPAGTRPTLGLHATGESVGLLQTMLRERHFDLALDSNFGPATRSAVLRFQRNHGLNVDGKVGPKTWAALEATVPPEDLRSHDLGGTSRSWATDVNDTVVRWVPNFDAAKWKISWRNPLVAANPPRYTGGRGTERDAAWKTYLAGFSTKKRGVLPNPEAVEDCGLRVIGNAATQLGVSYAWGGKGFDEPGRGTLYEDHGGGATKYQDDRRIGFDCSGLAQYAAWQTRYRDIGMGTVHQIGTPNLTTVRRGEALAPGDFIFYGTTPHHVAMYVAPGIVINAPCSGLPVQLDELSTALNDGTQAELIRARRLSAR